MKKYYLPGSISLWLLPLCCLFYLQNRDAFRQYYMLPAFRITQDFYAQPTDSGITFWHPPDWVNYNCILSGEHSTDRNNLKQAQNRLRKMVSEGDTIHGVYFHFEKNARYWAFVEALNICKKERALVFITLNNDIQAYYTPPVIPGNSILVPFEFCIVSFHRDETPKPFISLIWAHWDYLLIGILFGILIVIPTFIRLRKILVNRASKPM